MEKISNDANQTFQNKHKIYRLTTLPFTLTILTYIFITTLLSQILHIKSDDASDAQKIDTRIYQEVKNSEHFSSMEEFQEFVYRNDVSFLTYYYSTNHTFSKMGAFYLYKLENKLDYLAKIVFINCDEVKQKDTVKECNMKDKQGNAMLPRIKLGVPSKEKYNPISKKINIHNELSYSENSVSSETMYNFIVNKLVSHTQEINSKTLKGFLQKSLLNKVLVFQDEQSNKKDLEFDRYLKGLSNIFYDRILIGEVRNNTLAEMYKVNTYPSMVILENNFFRWEKPTSTVIKEKLTPDLIYTTLNKYSVKEKLYLRNLLELSLEEVKIFPLSGSTYHVFIEKFNKYNKVVFFTNGEENFNHKYKDLINNLNGMLVFAKINCKVYMNICEKYFDISFSQEEKDLFTSDVKSTHQVIKVRLYEGSEYKETTIYDSFVNSRELFNYYDDKNKDKSEKEIINTITKSIYSATELTYLSVSKKINSSELSKAIFSSRNEEKYNLIYFGDNNKKDSDEEKILRKVFNSFSGNEAYQDKVDFLEVDDVFDQKLMKLFKIKSIPNVVLVYHNKIDDEGFKTQSTTDITALGLKKLVENFVSDRDYKKPLASPEFKLTIMKDPFYLLSKCIYSPLPCLISLVDGEYEQSNQRNNRRLDSVNPNYYKNIDLLNNFEKDPSMFEFGSHFVVNATCHFNTMKAFKVQYSDLPTMIYFNGDSNTYYKFSKEDNFNLKNLENFITKAKTSQLVSTHILKEDVIVNRHDCSKVKEHKDRSIKFDYGGREFEDTDEDVDADNEVDKEFNKEFHERYEKIISEEKKKRDL